jgi:hypothetical protein
MQSVETAGPDGVREQGPILFIIMIWQEGRSASVPEELLSIQREALNPNLVALQWTAA